LDLAPVVVLAADGLLHKQAEPAGVLVDEVEVHLEGSPDPFAVPGRRGQGLTDLLLEGSGVGVEEGDVQLLLGVEVVVEDGLGDAGLLGHLIHGDAVEPGLAEDPAGHRQELLAPLRASHPALGRRWFTRRHDGLYYSRVTY